MEKLYLAYKNSELFAYSFDIHEFFKYLQNYYSVNGTEKITIVKKTDYLNSEFENIQSISPEFEIYEYYPDILLTEIEFKYWDNYFRGFYFNMTETFEKGKNKKLPMTYEEFIIFLGSEKLQKIINSFDYEFVHGESQFIQEFRDFLERNQDN